MTRISARSHGALIGAAAGTGGISVGGGPISTNASRIGQLKGWSVCFNGGGGSGLGASGTMCGGLDFHPDGTYTFNGIVSAQGSITATTPTAGGSAVLVRTYIVWRNGTLNVIREPFEAVGEHASGIFDKFERGYEQLVRPPLVQHRLTMAARRATLLAVGVVAVVVIVLVSLAVAAVVGDDRSSVIPPPAYVLRVVRDGD